MTIQNSILLFRKLWQMPKNSKNGRCLLMSICVCYIPTILYYESRHRVISESKTIYVISYCGYSGTSITWVHMIVHCILPFTLMVIGNISIIILMHKRIKERQKIFNKGNLTSDFDQLISLAILLICTNFTYIILTLPYATYLFIIFMFEEYFKHHFESEDEYWSAQQLFMLSSNGAEYLNNCVNFFLYCLGCTHFRKAFLSMMGLNTSSCCASSPAKNINNMLVSARRIVS